MTPTTPSGSISPSGNRADIVFSPQFLRDFHTRVDSIAAEELGRSAQLAEKVFAGLPDCFTPLKPIFLRDIASLGHELNPQFKNISTQALFRIQALQLVDAAWYESFPVYETDTQIMNDPDLVSYCGSDNNIPVFFSFIHLKESLFRRIPNALRRRWRIIFNHPAKNTMGLKCPRAPAEMILLLNALCKTTGKLVRQSKPYPVQVNDIVRSREHQDHLRKLGYPASGNSSHCRGFAADLEQRWYRNNHPRIHAIISGILSRLFEAGIINLIDYDSHWHICLNPMERGKCLGEDAKDLLSRMEP